MDFTTKELLKRYAKLAIGQPFAPILLNILVTSGLRYALHALFFYGRTR
ncbi:MAG: hypothetical protein WKF71_10730 [Pyrinomonadaceae bacterium]